MLDFLVHLYIPVLEQLDLNTLVDRHQYLNINFLRKLITGLVDSLYYLSKINFKVPQRLIRSYVNFSDLSFTSNYLQNETLFRFLMLAFGQ